MLVGWGLEKANNKAKAQHSWGLGLAKVSNNNGGGASAPYYNGIDLRLIDFDNYPIFKINKWLLYGQSEKRLTQSSWAGAGNET